MLTAHKEASSNWSADKARDRVTYVAVALASLGSLIGILSILFLR